MVIGSGVYRIGSSVEFDWCAVRSIQVGAYNLVYSYCLTPVSTIEIIILFSIFMQVSQKCQRFLYLFTLLTKSQSYVKLTNNDLRYIIYGSHHSANQLPIPHPPPRYEYPCVAKKKKP